MLQVEISEPAEGPVGLAALMRFERDADELTGSTAWVKEIPTWSPMAEYYIDQDEAGGPVLPVTTKVDMGNVDYATLTLGSVAHNTWREEVYFCTDLDPAAKSCAPRDDQRIIFNHFYYPGWRAFLLDGLHGEKVQELPILPEETRHPGPHDRPHSGHGGWVHSAGIRHNDSPHGGVVGVGD